MDQKSILIIGANGQLGKALRAQYPGAKAVDMAELDISDREQLDAFNWNGIKTILNAAGYTNVDGAETAEGRVAAWKANAAAVSNVACKCQQNGMTLVHISTDYVFDGTKTPHIEDEPLSPLSVYGASKAAGDIAVSTVPKHYILRTSWVIGDGKNFVRAMLELGKKGVNPSVVSDQIGRLTFTTELVRAIDHLIAHSSQLTAKGVQAPYGSYNISNDGKPASWANITREIFRQASLNNTVTDITSAEYYKNKPEAATRPLNSTLDLSKIQAVGFEPRDWQTDLKTYVAKELD